MVSVFRALLNARSVAVFMMIGSVGSIYAAGASYIGGFNSVTPLGTTVPSNGDVNPYGVALVPVSKGKLIAGNFLVSNFNNSGNAQGTGTTIVQMTPTGAQTLFAQINPDTVDCPGGVG